MIPDLTDPAFWLAPLASAGFGLLIVVVLLARFTRYWTRRKQRILEQHRIDAAAAATIPTAANDAIPMRPSLRTKARKRQSDQVRTTPRAQ